MTKVTIPRIRFVTLLSALSRREGGREGKDEGGLGACVGRCAGGVRWVSFGRGGWVSGIRVTLFVQSTNSLTVNEGIQLCSSR